MAEGAIVPVETLARPVTGRSLWSEARGRLLSNKAAVASMKGLAEMAREAANLDLAAEIWRTLAESLSAA